MGRDKCAREERNRKEREFRQSNPEFRAKDNERRRRYRQKLKLLRVGQCRNHGLRGTGAWKSWWFMKQRVTNPARKDYPRYKDHCIDPRWMVFENFYEDMGNRPEGLTLERIDNTKGYEPGNCKWETWLRQSRNKKSNKLTEEKVKEIRYKYFYISNAELARTYGVARSVIWAVKHRKIWTEVTANV
jgi:hypothetical protein